MNPPPKKTPPPSAAASSAPVAPVAASAPEPAAVFRSGFVALAGRANVGKSTLVNRLAGLRVAIVSPKPQTTRHAIRAIVDDGTSQIVFVDTPGLHKPTTRLGQLMVASAWDAFLDSDVAVLITDATRPGPDGHERQFCRKATEAGKPVVLCINKVDKVRKETLLPIMAAFAAASDFLAIVPVSASTGFGVDTLLAEIRAHLPEGPRYFPPETSTDQTERMLVAEIVRERILADTFEEIPHGTAVEIEAFEETDEGGGRIEGDETSGRRFVRIQGRILCEKETHKAILVGQGGSMIKRIGTESREAIERMLGCRVHLDLRVKTKEDWKNDRSVLRDLGYGPER